MPHFIATSGPTGIGKTYQMQRLMSQHPEHFTAVLSVTTRPRRGPDDDAWYRCVTRDELAALDPSDVLTDVTFRDERYILLKSEIEKALARAPVALMAIQTPVIMKMREVGIAHDLVRCRVGDVEAYRERLAKRGYRGEAIEREVAGGTGFVYPPSDPAWPEQDVFLGFPDDAARFDAAILAFAPELSALLHA